MRKSDENLPDQISIIWNIEDIKIRRPKGYLPDKECRIILDTLKKTHDANIGINWDVIDACIENYLRENESFNPIENYLLEEE